MGTKPNATNILGMVGAGINAVGAVGNILGIGQKRQDARQLEQQRKLNQDQLEKQAQLAENQRQIQMRMWEDTNYAAQVKQMEKAGLNPALMYGQGGGGGTTAGAGSAGSISGGQAANAAATQSANTQSQGMAMQNAMMMAQMKVMESQADKNKAEADATRGYKAEQATAGTQEAISRTEINKLEAELRGKSLEEQLQIIEYTREKLLGERDEAWAKGNIAQATQVDRIKLVTQELTNKAIEAIAMEKGVQLTESKITEITNSIQQKWQELNLSETKSRYEHADRLKAIEEYTENALKVAGIMAVGNVVRDVVGIATRKVPMGKTETTEYGKGWTHKTTDYK